MKNKLIIAQALLYSIVIIAFGFILIKEKVPAIKQKKATEKLEAYYQKKYAQENLKKGKIKKKGNSYQVNYYNKKYPNLFFTIQIKNNKITDNYQTNYLEGKNIINNIEQTTTKKYQEIFQNTNYQKIKVTFKNLNEYPKEDQINILTNNTSSKAYYNVSYYLKINNNDPAYLNNLLTSFIKIANNNNLTANSYSITVDNNGIINIINLDQGGNIIYE